MSRRPDRGAQSDRAVQAPGHTPVMLREVLEVLAPRDGGIYVDGTFGAGGYSRALLDAADCRVWAIDRDPAAIAGGKSLTERYPGRLALIEGRYGEMDALLGPDFAAAAQGVALDLGVSSMQIDSAERGFSFRHDGPLDMRMGGPAGGPSAAEVVNTTSEDALADILHQYGEERRARRVARAIVHARQRAPIERSGQLAEIVRVAVGRGTGEPGIDPATRSFQALRIYVNDELGELDRGLEAAERLLAPGGRLAVVAFHSLEDRVIKTFLRARSGGRARASRHLPETPGQEGPAATFSLLFRGAKKPRAEECTANPRARSARLRAAERTAAPPWPTGAASEVRP